MLARPRRRIFGRPVVGPAARIDAALVVLAVPRHAHRHHADMRPRRGHGLRRKVHVVQLGARALLRQDLCDDAAGQHGCPFEVRLRIVFERHGDAGDLEERAFDRRGHRAGVQDVDAGVESAVDAADDQVRASRTELEDA